MRFLALIEAVTNGKRTTPAEWVKAKTGYDLFTGTDRTLNNYAFRGSPSAKHMGIPDWPDNEAAHFQVTQT